MNKITVGYFADGPWSHQALERLLDDSSIYIAFICARHDNPDQILKNWAEKYQINYITHPQVNSDDFLHKVKDFNCELFVSMSFNQIFKKRLIELPRLQTINCHAGKLPFYRGRNILNWALINDEKEFGITVHYLDEGIDTGDILNQRTFPISDQDNYATLLKVAYIECADLLYLTIKQLQNGEINRILQSSIHKMGFYCTGRIAGDERLNWSQTSRDIFNFVRAICQPGPEARTYLRNNEIKINNVEFLPDAPIYKGIVGAVVGADLDCIYVKTLDSYVKITKWSGVERVYIGDRFL